MAQLVARELHAVTTPEERQRIVKEPTDNMDAYDYYLLGKHMRSEGGPKSIMKARDLFKKAIQTDSGFVWAYTGLALCYGNLAFEGSLRPDEAYPAAQKLAYQALELDSLFGEAFDILSVVDFYYYYDYINAEKNLLRALDLDPNNVRIHVTYAELFFYQGRFDEAIEVDNRAKALDPLYYYSSVLPGRHLYFAGEKDSAISHVKTVARRNVITFGLSKRDNSAWTFVFP